MTHSKDSTLTDAQLSCCAFSITNSTERLLLFTGYKIKVRIKSLVLKFTGGLWKPSLKCKIYKLYLHFCFSWKSFFLNDWKVIKKDSMCLQKYKNKILTPNKHTTIIKKRLLVLPFIFSLEASSVIWVIAKFPIMELQQWYPVLR